MEHNMDSIRGQWNQIKGSFKQKWGKLTDNDLKSFEGNFDTLKGKLQSLYGYTKERASTEIDDTIKSMKLATSEAKDTVVAKADSAINSAKSTVDAASAKLKN